MITQVNQWARKAGRATAAVLFPDSCLACGRHIDRQGGLCQHCWPRVTFIEKPYCAVTGAPFTHDFGDQIVSAQAIANPPVYDRARAACVHTDIARQLVSRLKYGDRTDLAPWMARWMARAGRELVEDADVIVPVPLHRLRLWRRRYNQSAELGRALSGLTGLVHEPLALARVKSTRPQVGLTATQRATNVRGVFRVPPEREIAVRGRSVLLVDDVLTTGATLEAAARALKAAGATGVLALCFSRVDPGHFDRG